VSLDVLEETDSWSQNPNAICDSWPEVSLVVCSESFTGCAEWLAGITAREDVHASRKRWPREGLEIAPDWSRIKRPAFHSREKKLDREGFDLCISDCAQIWDNASQSKVNSSVSTTEADMSDFGSIHIACSFGQLFCLL